MPYYYLIIAYYYFPIQKNTYCSNCYVLLFSQGKQIKNLIKHIK